MDPTEYAELCRRVDRLEVQVRWWRVVASATLVLVGFGAWLAGDLARVVETRRVLLVDRQGVERAWFGLDEDDTPHIELYDAHGEDVVGVAVLPDGQVKVDWPR